MAIRRLDLPLGERLPVREHGDEDQRSRTRRVEQARETQIIMQSLAAFSSSSRTESRWLGSPSSTGISQVPQASSAQEDSTPTPASSTSRMERSGGMVRVSRSG